MLWLQEYIHRVGRTARGEGGRGHALLILRPAELGFLRYLKQSKVPLNEFEFSWSKIANIQPQVSCSNRTLVSGLGSCLQNLVHKPNTCFTTSPVKQIYKRAIRNESNKKNIPMDLL